MKAPWFFLGCNVLSEAAKSEGKTSLAEYASQRPRPLIYDTDNEVRKELDQYLSISYKKIVHGLIQAQVILDQPSMYITMPL